MTTALERQVLSLSVRFRSRTAETEVQCSVLQPRCEEIPPLFDRKPSSQQYQKHYANDAEESERSFRTKAHSEKYMNVSDVNVTDEDDFLSRSTMIKAKNIIMKERTWIDRVAQRDVTNVKRSGQWLNIESRNLVPGGL